MKWRAMALMAACAAALTLGGRLVTADDKEKPAAGHDHHAVTAHDKCANACADCQVVCDNCSTHCADLVAQGKKEHLSTLRTCQDCASVCAAAASITARHGPFSDAICKACADACNRCAAECDKFPDDPHMKHCAEVCKACEKACRDMLGELKPAPAPK